MDKEQLLEKIKELEKQNNSLCFEYNNNQDPIPVPEMIKRLQPFIVIEKAITKAIKLIQKQQ